MFEKYVEFLPKELVRRGFAHGILGIKEMKARVRGWKKQVQARFLPAGI